MFGFSVISRSIHGNFKVYHHTDKVYSISVHSGYAASSSSDKTFQYWNLKTEELVFKKTFSGTVSRVKLTDDYLISSGYDGTVRFFSRTSGEELHRLDHSNDCNWFDHNKTGKLLAVAGDNFVVIWKVNGFEKLKTFEFNTFVMRVDFNDIGNKIIVGLHDGNIHLIGLE